MRKELGRGRDLFLGILLFGSIWGVFEVVLGAGLQAVNFPLRAGSLLGMGMFTMGVALALYRRPLMLIGIGIVTGLVKLLSIPLLHLSLTCKANSSLAVGLEALALTLVVGGLRERVEGGLSMRMGAGALGALLGAGGFYLVGMRVAPCSYLLSLSPLGFMVREGLSWALFSAILFPVGYLMGRRLQPTLSLLLGEKPSLGYATCIGISAVCWGFSALTIVAIGP